MTEDIDDDDIIQDESERWPVRAGMWYSSNSSSSQSEEEWKSGRRIFREKLVTRIRPFRGEFTIDQCKVHVICVWTNNYKWFRE